MAYEQDTQSKQKALESNSINGGNFILIFGTSQTLSEAFPRYEASLIAIPVCMLKIVKVPYVSFTNSQDYFQYHRHPSITFQSASVPGSPGCIQLAFYGLKEAVQRARDDASLLVVATSVPRGGAQLLVSWGHQGTRGIQGIIQGEAGKANRQR